jgi:hypothetical protein
MAVAKNKTINNQKKAESVMNTKKLENYRSRLVVGLACVTVGLLSWIGSVCHAQVNIHIGPPVVVVAPPPVVVAPPAVVVAPPPPPPVEVAPPAPPQPEVNFQYFHDQLAPWGTWVDLPGVGPAWQPAANVTGASPDWRPYYDNGQWVHTDNGLFWQSDYSWGDIPFHYGRWSRTPAYGWVWVPEYEWGPAWVFWRHAEGDGALGWAALPPGAVIVDGGYMFNGVRVGLDFDFHFGEDAFVFVDGAHFGERYFRLRGREYRYHVGHERLHGYYGRSVIRNDFHRDRDGRLVNEGIGRDRVDRMTNHRMEQAKLEERHPVGDRDHAAGHGEAGHGEAGKAGAGGKATPAKAGGGAPASKAYKPPVSSPAKTASAAPAKSSSSSSSSSGGKKK